jgi:hypothetical protein
MTYKLTNTSQPADPYYGAVSVLLDGRAFEDRSVNPKTIGGTFELDTSQSKWHGISYSTGSSFYSYMSVQNTGGAFNFGSENFTVEFWFRASFIQAFNYVLLNFGTGFRPLYLGLSGFTFVCYASTSGTAWDVNINSGLTVTRPDGGSSTLWHHFAFVRHGNVFTPYLDGVAGNSVTHSGSLVTTTSNLNIGGYTTSSSGRPFGNFNDIRITKGVARYTSNFTPPAQPFQSLAA